MVRGGDNPRFTKTEQRLLEEMAEMEIIDCHEHLPPEKTRVDTLQDVFTLFSHYTRLPLVASGLSLEEKASLHNPGIPLETRWKTFRPHLRNIRLEFLARLYFFRRLGLSGLDRLVAEQQALYRARVESLARAAAQADDDFARLVLEFRQGQLKAAIRWLDRCLETS